MPISMKEYLDSFGDNFICGPNLEEVLQQPREIKLRMIDKYGIDSIIDSALSPLTKVFGGPMVGDKYVKEFLNNLDGETKNRIFSDYIENGHYDIFMTIKEAVEDDRLVKPSDNNQRFPYFTDMLSVLLQKTENSEDFKKWDGEVKEMVVGYQQRYGYSGMNIQNRLAPLVKKIKSYEMLVKVKECVIDFYNTVADRKEFGRGVDLYENALLILLDRISEPREMDKWHDSLKPLFKDNEELKKGDKIRKNQFLQAVMGGDVNILSTMAPY